MRSMASFSMALSNFEHHLAMDICASLSLIFLLLEVPHLCKGQVAAVAQFEDDPTQALAEISGNQNMLQTDGSPPTMLVCSTKPISFNHEHPTPPIHHEENIGEQVAEDDVGPEIRNSRRAIPPHQLHTPRDEDQDQRRRDANVALQVQVRLRVEAAEELPAGRAAVHAEARPCVDQRHWHPHHEAKTLEHCSPPQTLPVSKVDHCTHLVVKERMKLLGGSRDNLLHLCTHVLSTLACNDHAPVVAVAFLGEPKPVDVVPQHHKEAAPPQRCGVVQEPLQVHKPFQDAPLQWSDLENLTGDDRARPEHEQNHAVGAEENQRAVLQLVCGVESAAEGSTDAVLIAAWDKHESASSLQHLQSLRVEFETVLPQARQHDHRGVHHVPQRDDPLDIA
mmetsp:Transcript_51666/g.166192  ORF Transcript_51666/g.166192 Transcript_51666/m.166192 type:complete len:393 (+) Transcript_51666:260-1438(+)